MSSLTDLLHQATGPLQEKWFRLVRAAHEAEVGDTGASFPLTYTYAGQAAAAKAYVQDSGDWIGSVNGSLALLGDQAAKDPLYPALSEWLKEVVSRRGLLVDKGYAPGGSGGAAASGSLQTFVNTLPGEIVKRAGELADKGEDWGKVLIVGAIALVVLVVLVKTL